MYNPNYPENYPPDYKCDFVIESFDNSTHAYVILLDHLAAGDVLTVTQGTPHGPIFYYQGKFHQAECDAMIFT